MIFLAVAIACGLAAADTSPDEEYCNSLKLAGTGVVDIATSVVDRRLALEYYNVLYGEGDFEMNTGNRVSTDARGIEGSVDGSTVPMNLYETTTLSFRGKTPLIGFKMIRSRAFWGGIGAEIIQSFAVTEMDMTQDTFFTSARHTSMPNVHEMPDPHKVFDQIKAGPGDLVGMQVRNSFNGTWTTDASWHKLLEKDIKHHKSFTGTFEVEDTLKFHENQATDRGLYPCGVDC